MRGLGSEFHGYARPGRYPQLTISAEGFHDRVLRDLVIRDDGPTTIDAELEPLA